MPSQRPGGTAVPDYLTYPLILNGTLAVFSRQQAAATRPLGDSIDGKTVRLEVMGSDNAHDDFPQNPDPCRGFPVSPG